MVTDLVLYDAFGSNLIVGIFSKRDVSKRLSARLCHEP